MTVPPPEYGEEDRLRQQPRRMPQQPEGVLPPGHEDAPEREAEQHGRQGREVQYLDLEDNEAHAPGRVCERCGAAITAGEDVRRRDGGRWIHEACPVGPAGQPSADPGSGQA